MKTTQVTENKRKAGSESDSTDRFRDFQVPTANLEAESRADRLNQAIKATGRRKDVAQLSGVPLSTLNAYLAGGEMKLSSVLALADACKVSIEWLATGRGPMRPGANPPPAEPPPDSQPSAPVKLFATIDMERMGLALETTVAAFTARGATPGWRRIAQVAMLIYDVLDEPEGQPKELAHIMSADWTDPKKT